MHSFNSSGLATLFASSYLIFHRYEQRRLLPALSLLFVVPAAMNWVLIPSSDAVAIIPSIYVLYWSLLVLFTVTYRISPFHPLAKYPGPIINKITSFEQTYRILKGDRYLKQIKLHEKYGDIVRTAPNEVVINNVDAIEPVLGFPGLPKGPEEYAPRRRLWNTAFSTASLKNYEENIVQQIGELIETFRGRKDEPSVDISKFMEFFSFDIMGHMVFSVSFGLVKAGTDVRGYRRIIIETMQNLVFLVQTPWLVYMLSEFVDAGSHLKDVAKEMMLQRLKTGSKARDLFYYLSDEDDTGAPRSHEQRLLDECFTAIVAGSDSASTALAALWYFLLQNPSCYERLRVAIDEAFPANEEPIDQKKLSAIPYLNACINEAMRLLPPVSYGTQREVPVGSGGRMIVGHFFAELTKINIPIHTIQRYPRYFFPYPNLFWPDRWLAPENRRSFSDITKSFEDNKIVIHNMAAYMPFSAGPRTCPEKNFAIMEMRAVVASIVRHFDMRVAEGFNLDDWEKSLADIFILVKGRLPVVLTERSF